MLSTVCSYIRESECRDCGEFWTSTVYPATRDEPSDETGPSCPKCGGHDTECDCEDCRKSKGRAA